MPVLQYVMFPTLHLACLQHLDISAGREGLPSAGARIAHIPTADIVLAENQHGMQKMLSYIYEWYKKWRLSIN